MPVSFNHVALRVRDVGASVQFLQTVLGESVKTIHLLGDADSDGPRVSIVGTRGGVFFDLFSEGGAAPKDGPDYGLIHYAFGVEDVDAAYAAALDAGATEMTAPMDIEMPDRPGVVVRAAYVYDPNGDVCEFVDHDWIDKL